ncbi:hypothetical protein ACS0TY_031280 [Phlomoides rotata]
MVLLPKTSRRSLMWNDVKIINQLPEKAGKVITTRAPRKCNKKCYETRILPIYQRKRVVQLTKFDYRLSNRLAVNLQKLRCRVNYHALQFTDPIFDLGMKLVQRMRMKSKHYVALHLRFMVGGKLSFELALSLYSEIYNTGFFGLQTIAVVVVIPHGVVQLGSLHKKHKKVNTVKVDVSEEQKNVIASEFENFTTLAERLRVDYEFGHTFDAKVLPRGDSSATWPLVRLLKPFDELFVDFQEFDVDALVKFVEETSTPTVTLFSKDPKHHPFVIKYFNSPNAKGPHLAQRGGTPKLVLDDLG